MISEASVNEFTLVCNNKDKAFPVLLTKEQHQMLQAFIAAIGEVKVISSIEVEYKS